MGSYNKLSGVQNSLAHPLVRLRHLNKAGPETGSSTMHEEILELALGPLLARFMNRNRVIALEAAGDGYKIKWTRFRKDRLRQEVIIGGRWLQSA